MKRIVRHNPAMLRQHIRILMNRRKRRREHAKMASINSALTLALNINSHK
jgi:hypothetical protein